MDFTASLTTAEKIAACDAAEDQISARVYEYILMLGVDPATFDGASYVVPAGHEDALVYAVEHELKERLDALAAVKAHKTSLS
jgi:hypothetical protein